MTEKEKEAIESLEAALVKLENTTQETIRRLVSEEGYLNHFEKLSYKKKRPATLSTLLDYHKTRIIVTETTSI
jgi:ribosomal protein S8